MDSSISHKTTILIKTFERPRDVLRLISTIYGFYPDIRIIVADDSRDTELLQKKIKKYWPTKNITHLPLAFNMGLSAGRNAALAQVTTEYFVLCDDDFLFTEHTSLERLHRTASEENVDIVCGTFLEIKDSHYPVLNWLTRKVYVCLFYFGQSFCLPVQKILCGHIDIADRVLTVQPVSQAATMDIIPSDIGHNFFLAKTSTRDLVLWREELKLLEHLVYFNDAKRAEVSVVVDSRVSVNHLRNMSLRYRSFRYGKENKVYHHKRLELMDIDSFDDTASMIIKPFEGTTSLLKI